MKYLVIDDERIILSGMERILRKIDGDSSTIFLAQTPYEALDIVKAHKDIDIIFSDVDMPGMNGLELVDEIYELCPDADIIFATGYAHYSLEAWNTYAKAFILKPVDEEDVRKAIGKVKAFRNPNEGSHKSSGCRIEARCFGDFEIFCDGKPVRFTRKKSKEMLAYLIDRKGAMISTGTLRMTLWEEAEDSEEKKGYVRVLANDIRKCFDSLGVSDFLLNNNDCYSVDVNQMTCDYYDYLSGRENAVNKFKGEYMMQYSWGELTLASLL